MLSKVQGVSFTRKTNSNNSIAKNAQTNPMSQKTQSYTQVGADKLASSYRALNNISFTGSQEKQDFIENYVTDKELRIPNILAMTEDISIGFSDMPEGKEKFNTAGLNIHIEKTSENKTITIGNDKHHTIAKIQADTSLEDLPTITYKQGKFMPEITVKDESLNGKSIKMLAGSELKGNGFKVVMPGDYYPNPNHVNGHNISFTGNAVITTLNKEPRTKNAVDMYMDDDLMSEAVKGDYYDETKADDVTGVIPAGGFGERFFNVTREQENKPSGKLPTRNNYRIMATALNGLASMGVLEGGGNDNIIYASQAHEIKGDDVVQTRKYKTDGGAIAEALSRDIIANDKPMAILNADIFTNADLTRTYHALKTLPDAALVIPYYPVNPQRAKSFGLLGVEVDNNGNNQIKEFLEKPKYTSEAPLGSDFTSPGDYDKAVNQFKKVQTSRIEDTDQFMANPGFYFLSPKANKVLMAQGIIEPGNTGLGANVMPKIVALANEGRLKDEEGHTLKAYTVPLEAKGGKPAVWNDIGTMEAYLGIIKDVAYETRTYGTGEENKYFGIPEFVMTDFMNNVDPSTGIVFDSKEARESLDNFKNKYDVQSVRGNIFVASPN